MSITFIKILYMFRLLHHHQKLYNKICKMSDDGEATETYYNQNKDIAHNRAFL